MNGTNTTGAAAGLQDPAFMAELIDRLEAIASGGATPWNDEAEKRREARRRDMEIARTLSLKAAVHLTDAMAGRLPAEQCAMFAGMTDPITALANLNRSIVQVALAEERFDETGEERAARLTREAEAHDRAECAARDKRAFAAAQLRRAVNRRQVHHTVRELALSQLRLTYERREDLLGGLFAELDKDPSRFECDPAEVIAEISRRLGVTVELTPADKDRFAERRKKLVTAARDHLDVLRGGHEIDEDCVSAPPAQAQGPPH